LARHPDHPNAFTRCRKLALPGLIAMLLSMRGHSQQVTLDAFFGSLCNSPLPCRGVSDRAFAKARSHLHLPALTALNDMLVQRADAAGLVPRWLGLRVVAGDGSVLMPAVRKCSRTRGLASADQRLFALFLPGAELTLHACVYDAQGSERQLLVESLDRLGPEDLLVLDRGYPASWLVAVLQELGVRWCMRCDNGSGWAPVRAFMRTASNEAFVTLSPPSASDDQIWGCGRTAPTVRLVRQISPGGAVRVLATNLDATDFPCHAFAGLYHQRWRIEEGFKRLKLRLHLESVSGLSQQALIIDVAAKILADNLASLLCTAAAEHADLPARSRRCNRSYAASLFPRAAARLMLAVGEFSATVDEVLSLLATTTQRFVVGRSSPRPSNHTKPHPNLAYKG
jgi:hypothetical protein